MLSAMPEFGGGDAGAARSFIITPYMRVQLRLVDILYQRTKRQVIHRTCVRVQGHTRAFYS